MVRALRPELDVRVAFLAFALGITLAMAAEALKKERARRIIGCCTHAVLSGPAIKRIEECPLEELIVTNTIPLNGDRARCRKIKVLSVARLLGQAIRSIHAETSVSSLFV